MKVTLNWLPEGAYRCRPIRTIAVSLIVFALLAPTLGAQEIGDDWEDPTISISPSGGTFTNPSVSVTITWCDNVGLNAGSRQIKHNGVTKTGSFSYSNSGGGCYTSTGTLTLTNGSNSVYGYICDTSWLCANKTVYLTYDSGKKAPTVTTPHMSQDVYDPSLCGVGCSDFTISYTPPTYRSLDTERVTTLLYRSDQARPVPMVLLQVYDPSTDPADTISVRLKKDWTGGWQTLHTGSTEVYYDNPNTVNYTTQVAAAFDAGSLSTGAYDFTAYVYSRWRDGTTKETQVPVRVLVVNEEDSPYGWGWTIAGLQRVHTQVLGGSEGVVLTDGTGAIGFFEEASCTGSPVHCLYDTPSAWTGDLEYDEQFTNGRRYRRWFDDGTEIYYDASGRMVSAEDRYGNKTTYAYDGSGRVTSITDPVGKVTTFGYGGDSKLAWIKDPSNQQSTITINGSYDVTDILDPAGGEPLGEMVYSGHRMTRYYDRANERWDVAYDFAGRVATVTAPSVRLHNGTSARPVTTTKSVQAWLMDASSSLASPGNRRNSWHRRVRVTDPEGDQTDYRELSEFGQPERIEMERGRVARVLYDWRGQMTREVSPAGDSVSYVWSNQRLVSRTDHTTNRTTSYTYTSHGNIATVSGSGQPTITHLYDSNGSRHTTKVGSLVLYTYLTDSRGRLTRITDADGFKQQISFYTSGYLNRSQIIRGGETTKERYDGRGRLLHLINPANDTLTYTYDHINRVTSVNDYAGNTTSFGYSAMFRTSVTDPLGQVYANYPNALGWDTIVADPGGREEKYGYDKDGTVRSYTNRRNQTVTYVFNDAHEMTSMTAGGQTTSYSVSVDLLTRTASNSASTDTVQFIPNSRRVEQRTKRGGQRWDVEWDYDTKWRQDYLRIRRNDVQQHWVNYNYDGSGRMHQLAAQSVGTTDIGFDPRFNAETFRWSHTADTLALSHPSYGSPGRYRYSNSTVEDFAGLRYSKNELKWTETRWNGDLTQWDSIQHNDLGMITRVRTYTDSNPGGGTCEWDDDIGDLCEPSGSAQIQGTDWFTWDAVGNPSGETVDSAGQLTSLGSMSFTYDLDGNITHRSGGGDTISYWWNALGQLDSLDSNVDGKVRYKYDGWGRRVYTNDATGTTHFLWDDDDVIADINTSGTATRYYNYYPGMSNLHSMRTASPNAGYLYLRDLTGNVLGLRNTSGTIVNSYEYSPFGELESVSESVANRFRFASGEQDVTGQYYFRARYYDPEYMRFTSRDPIGLAGGINPYVYSGNNPIDFRDPSGLCKEEEEVNGECPVAPIPIEGVDIVVYFDKKNGESDNFLSRDRPIVRAGGPRRRLADRCDADMRQFTTNVAMHMAGVGMFTSAYRTGRLAVRGTAHGGRFAAAFIAGAAVEPFTWAMWAADDAGSTNPWSNSFARGMYGAAKVAPFTSVAVDGWEAFTSCVNAVAYGG